MSGLQSAAVPNSPIIVRTIPPAPVHSVLVCRQKNFLAFLHGQNFFLFKKLQLVGKFAAKVTEKTKVY